MMFLVASLLTPAAVAFSQVRLEDGTALRWTDDNPWISAPYVPLAGNTRNSAGVPPEALQASVIRGLQRWQAASNNAFYFDYWQGDPLEIYAANQEQDGLSTIWFASANREASAHLSGAVAAHTQIWYAPDSNAITEIDIVLNDLWFGFTDDPLKASYGDEGQLGRTLYLDDVITHELGHALGLGHSGVLRSSMFPQAWTDQAHLGCDDIAAIRTAYSDERGLGRVTGQVIQPDGRPVFGAQVTAFSRSSEDGDSGMIATMTEADGSYTLEGLSPGTWFVVAEPVYEEDSLSTYYSELDHHICGGVSFARSFLVEGDGQTLTPLAVTSESWLTTQAITVSCDDGATVADSGAGEGVLNALVVTDGAEDFALVDTVELAGDERWYRLDDVEGTLSIEIISFSLFSPAWLRPKLLDVDGDLVAGVSLEEPRYEDEANGYTLWDSRLTVTLPERGTYYLTLEAHRLSELLYPSPTPIDALPFVVLLGGPVDLEAPEARFDCALGEDFPDYTSPPGDPLRREVSLEESGSLPAEAAPSGCAAAPAPSGGALVVWLLLLIRRARDEK